MTAVMVAGLVLAVLIIVGNTMIAIAFLRDRGLKSKLHRDGDAMDELHRRVEALHPRRK